MRVYIYIYPFSSTSLSFSNVGHDSFFRRILVQLFISLGTNKFIDHDFYFRKSKNNLSRWFGGRWPLSQPRLKPKSGKLSKQGLGGGRRRPRNTALGPAVVTHLRMLSRGYQGIPRPRNVTLHLNRWKLFCCNEKSTRLAVFSWFKPSLLLRFWNNPFFKSLLLIHLQEKSLKFIPIAFRTEIFRSFHKIKITYYWSDKSNTMFRTNII